MGETKEYPAVHALLVECDKYPTWNYIHTSPRDPYMRGVEVKNADLATELRALLAERAVLQKECNDRAECEQSLARWNDELAADRDAWKEKAEGYSDIVERGAKHWLDLQNTHQIAWEGALDDAMAAACTEIKALAAKLEAAERRLDDEKALRFHGVTAAPARRLREVQFDGYVDWFRWNDGTLEALVGNPPRWKARAHIRTEWIHAVAALRDDPFEPVETVEGVERTRAEMEEMEDNDCAAYEDKAHTRAVYETACRRVLKTVRALRAVRDNNRPEIPSDTN